MLPTPVSITRLGFDIGFDRDERIFAANNRVRRVKLIYSDGSVQFTEFFDRRGIQYVDVPGVITSKIEIMIDEVYPGDKYDDTCIAEVEIWGYAAP
jgi:hypothetical protein